MVNCLVGEVLELEDQQVTNWKKKRKNSTFFLKYLKEFCALYEGYVCQFFEIMYVV